MVRMCAEVEVEVEAGVCPTSRVLYIISSLRERPRRRSERGPWTRSRCLVRFAARR